jgi:hypothetical protein
MIPPAVWGFLLRWGAVLAAAFALFAGGWFKGSERVKAQWSEATARAEQAAEAQRAAQQNKINALTLSLAQAKAKREVVTKTVIQEVDKYAPASLPMLPGSFRVLYDAAVAGEAPDDSRVPDAAPVAPATVGRNAAINYGACREDQARLEALQAIVRSITGE